MFKAIALFGFKKSSKPFKDYYKLWFKTLKNVLLPQLRNAMSSSSTSSPILLASHVEVIHRHFLNYYETLDLAASNDVAQVLYPHWRTPFEIPFLWLGDLHPYLFINLLRSFIADSENDPEDMFDPEKQNWHVVMAWKSPGKRLTNRVDQIECGLRLMVPALAARARDAKAAFVKKVAAEWGNQRLEMNGAVAEAAARELHAREGRDKERKRVVAEEAARGMNARGEAAREGWRKEDMRGVVVEAARVEMEELVGVFVDANRLRRSVLSDILSVTDVYQAAVFLEALAQFLVGFRNRELLSQFDKSSLEL
ncbi:protein INAPERTURATE POLLEN1 [Lycium barbarum]|uniref:protein INAPERTURATE POLLEN1 n=1 Tax=Lycium barbarum TaxID=112863 RepID=UPI00293E6727|nr:protein INAPERTURATE POLLEN1 [Lycium barbarum]